MSLGARERESLGLLDPRQLGNLEAWYDAEFINGFAGAKPVDGDVLSQWNDISGNSRHVLQASVVNRPVFRTPRAAGIVNLCQNPRLGVNVTGWTTNNGTLYAVTRDTVNGHLGSAAAACINNGSGSGVAIGSMYIGSVSTGFPASIPVTPGKAYHISVWAKVSRAALVNFQIALRNVAGTVVPFTTPVSSKYGSVLSGSLNITPANQPVAANTWVKFDVITSIVPAGATVIVPSLSAATNPSVAAALNDTLWGTKCLVEEWPSDGQYVDGATGGDFGWVGTAHASSTVRLTGDPIRVQFDGAKSILNQIANLMTYTADTPVSIYAVVSGGAPNANNTNSRIGAIGSQFGIYYGNDSTSWGLIISGVLPVVATAPPGRLFVGFTKNDLTNVYSTVNGSALPVPGAQPGKPLRDVISVGSIGTAFFAGNISSLLIFSENHKEQKRRRIEQWLAARYSVPLLRP